MIDQSTLVTVAALIAGFGSAVLVFRIQREVDMAAKGETTWVPWADRLIITATLLALVFGIFPFVSGFVVTPIANALAMAASSGAVVLLFGYVFAILAHYRLIFGGGRTGPRDNPEPAERWIIWLTVIVAASVFGVVLCHSWGV
jgi:hypothetical protein